MPKQLFKNTPFDLSGKTAIVTGAAGLLGLEHSLALLEANATVVLTDISEQSLQEARERVLATFPQASVFQFEMDVANSKSVQDVCDRLKRQGMTPEILINNAAVNPGLSQIYDDESATRLEKYPEEAWHKEINVGLLGAFLCCKYFGQAMAEGEAGGVIVNIASDLSVIAPDQRLYRRPSTKHMDQPVKPVTYSVVKAGLIGLTRYLATYWVDVGIRCNALSPGGVYTDQDADFVKKLSDLIPLGRMARMNEYRAAIQFLCSDASSYMTGQNLIIDGGRTVL